MFEFLEDAFLRGVSQLLCCAQQGVCYIPRWLVATFIALLVTLRMKTSQHRLREAEVDKWQANDGNEKLK